MDNEIEFPTIKDVENQITCYTHFVNGLMGTTTDSYRCSEKDLGHFIVAAWICKKHKVSPRHFLARHHKKHRKMESGKIVRSHQLSTEFAKQTALELQDIENSRRPESRARRDALLNSDVPLSEDRRYCETVDRLSNYPGMTFEGWEDDLIYAAQRQLDELGEVDAELITAIRKTNVAYEVIP